MSALSFLGKIYDLDTLDTRFTVSSNTPYKAHLEARNDAAASKERAAKWNSRTPKSRWNTTEFYLYYLVFVLSVPYMFWVAYDASRSTTYNFDSNLKPQTQFRTSVLGVLFAAVALKWM
jgi:protein-cysteine N-palmitoyltransferase HHAT